MGIHALKGGEDGFQQTERPCCHADCNLVRVTSRTGFSSGKPSVVDSDAILWLHPPARSQHPCSRVRRRHLLPGQTDDENAHRWVESLLSERLHPYASLSALGVQVLCAPNRWRSRVPWPLCKGPQAGYWSGARVSRGTASQNPRVPPWDELRQKYAYVVRGRVG